MTRTTAITCDGCGKDVMKRVPMQYLLLTSNTMGLFVEDKFFCTFLCLSVWVGKRSGLVET